MQKSAHRSPQSFAGTMKENKKQTAVNDPVTKDDIVNALHRLGVTGNMILEVHSSLSSFHYVIGGARTVVDALIEVAGEGGTILMPTQVSDNTEPSDWVNPPVAASLYRTVRAAIPPYDPKNSDISSMGEIVKNFRHRDGVEISGHPNVSYAAYGRYARLLCNRQSTHFPLAEESPAARLYELKGFVLLLGADFDSCTCMHLAEYRTDCRPIKINGSKVSTPEGDKWVRYLDLDIDSSSFTKVRQRMAAKNMIRETNLGGCHIQFFSAVNAIDEAEKMFEQSVYELYR